MSVCRGNLHKQNTVCFAPPLSGKRKNGDMKTGNRVPRGESYWCYLPLRQCIVRYRPPLRYGRVFYRPEPTRLPLRTDIADKHSELHLKLNPFRKTTDKLGFRAGFLELLHRILIAALCLFTSFDSSNLLSCGSTSLLIMHTE